MSQIKQLIDQDERIVYCKKQSKILYKNLKKNNEEIKLMHCQIKVAQDMGYEDWFDLYNKVKHEIEQKNKEEEDKENIFEMMLKEALNVDATDIHVEYMENKSSISMRINGELKELVSINYEEAKAVAQDIYYSLYHRVFNYKDIKNYQKNRNAELNFNPYDFQQIGTIFDCDNYNLLIDYQSTPIHSSDKRGFHINVKIKDKNKYASKNSLSELGYHDSQVKLLETYINRPIGSIVIGGVTGSGMKTTLKTLLETSLKQNPQSNIVSVASQHLYYLDNLKQVPVIYSQEDFKNDSDIPLYKSINAVKRMDADFVFIDQLKGNMPVKAYKDLCFSGTNVTATIKAKSSIDIIQQFKNYGLKSETLASEFFLNLIVHQELMPKVCKCCGIGVSNVFKKNSDIDNDTKIQILSLLKKIEYKYIVNNIDKVLIRNNKGCHQCYFMGIKGRTVCAEVIEVDNVMRDLILKNKLIELYDYYRSLSNHDLHSTDFQGKTITEHALHKMLQGSICPSDILKNFGEDLK